MNDLHETKNKHNTDEIELIKEKIQALDNTHKQYKQANRPFKTKEINAYHF